MQLFLGAALGRGFGRSAIRRSTVKTEARQLCARLRGQWVGGKSLGQGRKLSCAFGAPPHFHQRHTLPIKRVRSLVVVLILLQDPVVLPHRIFVVALARVYVGDIKLSVRREFGVPVPL